MSICKSWTLGNSKRWANLPNSSPGYCRNSHTGQAWLAGFFHSFWCFRDGMTNWHCLIDINWIILNLWHCLIHFNISDIWIILNEVPKPNMPNLAPLISCKYHPVASSWDLCTATSTCRQLAQEGQRGLESLEVKSHHGQQSECTGGFPYNEWQATKLSTHDITVSHKYSYLSITWLNTHVTRWKLVACFLRFWGFQMWWQSWRAVHRNMWLARTALKGCDGYLAYLALTLQVKSYFYTALDNQPCFRGRSLSSQLL